MRAEADGLIGRLDAGYCVQRAGAEGYTDCPAEGQAARPKPQQWPAFP